MTKRSVGPRRIALARAMRRRSTDAERKMWQALRSLRADGIKFRRQHPIGRYILDFVALEQKLVVEVDGGQHDRDPAKTTDRKRTQWLQSKGYRVVRFWDNDVLTNIDGVAAAVRQLLPHSSHPHLTSPFEGEENKTSSPLKGFILSLPKEKTEIMVSPQKAIIRKGAHDQGLSQKTTVPKR